MHMHPAQFSATVQHRKHLTRIKPAIGIKSAFQSLLLREICFTELGGHQITLFNAHAMFAGQHTANFHTQA